MTDNPPHHLVGRVLADRYEIGESVGHGGMSVVFAARDRRLGRPVAVKVIHVPGEHTPAGEEIRARFRREAAAAACIPPHPNVVQIFDYGTDPELDVDFIVMELLQGRDLKAAIGDKPVPPGEAVRLLLDAARGVAAGHRAGVVHRDIKPANLFLVAGDGSGESVRVLDFGIAKPLQVLAEEDITVAGYVPLSPAYASPEQLHGGSEITAASDVYQLGLVAYELLSGARPFSAEERKEMATGGALPLPQKGRWAEAPAAVGLVVERALQPRAAERFPDAAAFAEALTASTAEEATPALPVARGDETMLMGAPTPPAPTLPPVLSVGNRSRISAPLLFRLAAGAAVLLLLVWALSRLVGGSDDFAAPTAAADPTGLEGEFRDLEAEAAATLANDAPLPSR